MFVEAIGGQELYDKEKFQQQNISLSFLNTELTEYKQFKNEFVPYLSIIDVQ
ncbi:MAG: WbqC family protein [Campylobacterota bacterium]